ncbi:hypothetical protein SAMN05216412_11367 [Nitrosospira multiformis]|uniref:Uncharacterized protein n=1 Tax=Nitrosospira multiformis TaxID=1231 RepID=A0A1I0GKM4_9PROT|nr:hypothetical protein [Nitrosospira multiformis]SET70610.1 hypothetical protein SAMN05216412_11367 [Nitrosospira multiformis]
MENYLSHVPKDRILAIVAEAVSPPHAQSMNGLKKSRSGAASGTGFIRFAMGAG